MVQWLTKIMLFLRLMWKLIEISYIKYVLGLNTFLVAIVLKLYFNMLRLQFNMVCDVRLCIALQDRKVG